MVITAGNEVAITGSEGFGITVYPGVFDPPCDAYAADPDNSTSSSTATYFRARSEDGAPGRFVNVETWSSAAGQEDPYGLAFLRNITNQPVFANDSGVCDNYRRLFNTSLTTLPQNAPVPVRGRVEALIEPFYDDGDADGGETQVWEDGVFGWRVSTAFLEPPVAASCASLQGFSVD